jgi:D-alanyl-D-alanine carboxypeptidase
MRHASVLAELGISAEIIAEKRLHPHLEAEQLEVAEIGVDGREHRLTPQATAQWLKMRVAAQANGIEIFIVSAFRSVERQIQIIQYKMDAGQALADILSASAPPGYSEHHTGRAIDIGTAESENLTLEFGNTSAFSWLQKHAHEFGFVMSYPAGNSSGYQYEPWHWCLVGESESA